MEQYSHVSNEDILEFLKRAYFNTEENDFKLACNKAYLDLSRTIQFEVSLSKMSKNQRKDVTKKRQELKKKILSWLQKEVESLNNPSEYDDWHNRICEGIIERFSENGKAVLSYGQAQKWLNMTMKYLIVIGNDNIQRLIPYLHVPIDNIVLDLAYEQFGISVSTEKPWSQWDKEDYLHYQSTLKNGIAIKYPNLCPIKWEFQFWKQPFEEITNEKRQKDASKKRTRHTNPTTSFARSRNNNILTPSKKTPFPLQEDSDVTLESFIPFCDLTNRVHHDEFVSGYIIPLKEENTDDEKKFMLFVAHHKKGYFCEIRYCYDKVDILDFRPFSKITQNKDGIKWERSSRAFPTFKSVEFGEKKKDALCLMQKILKDINAPQNVMEEIKKLVDECR